MKQHNWKTFAPAAWLLGAAIQLLLARFSYQSGEMESAGVQIVIAILISIHAIRGFAMMLVRRNARK